MDSEHIDLNNISQSSNFDDEDFLVVSDVNSQGNEINETKKIKFGSFVSQILPHNARPGYRGAKGAKGNTGESGPKGDKGEKGETGETGITGLRGYFGFAGLKGDKGDVGDDGVKGSKGNAGQRGDTGLLGDVGIKGAKGPKGESGPRGYRGQKGIDGDKGRKGSKGPRGKFNEEILKGEKGDKGPKGFSRKGHRGEVGDKGISGERGDRGSVGDPGRDNLNIVTTAHDLKGDAWVQMNKTGNLLFSDTRLTAYNPNSRLLFVVKKGNYHEKWETPNELYAEVCLQNADFVKGPTSFSGFLKSTSSGIMYPVVMMPYFENEKYELKVCVFDGYDKYDIPYDVYECDEF